jgi:hypothetical protein
VLVIVTGSQPALGLVGRNLSGVGDGDRGGGDDDDGGDDEEPSPTRGYHVVLGALRLAHIGEIVTCMRVRTDNSATDLLELLALRDADPSGAARRAATVSALRELTGGVPRFVAVALERTLAEVDEFRCLASADEVRAWLLSDEMCGVIETELGARAARIEDDVEARGLIEMLLHAMSGKPFNLSDERMIGLVDRFAMHIEPVAGSGDTDVRVVLSRAMLNTWRKAIEQLPALERDAAHVALAELVPPGTAQPLAAIMLEPQAMHRGVLFEKSFTSRLAGALRMAAFTGGVDGKLTALLGGTPLVDPLSTWKPLSALNVIDAVQVVQVPKIVTTSSTSGTVAQQALAAVEWWKQPSSSSSSSSSAAPPPPTMTPHDFAVHVLALAKARVSAASVIWQPGEASVSPDVLCAWRGESGSLALIGFQLKCCAAGKSLTDDELQAEFGKFAAIVSNLDATQAAAYAHVVFVLVMWTKDESRAATACTSQQVALKATRQQTTVKVHVVRLLNAGVAQFFGTTVDEMRRILAPDDA